MKIAHRLGFKDLFSFGVQLGLDKTSANGFEDGLTLGIKLVGIGLTPIPQLQIKPTRTNLS
jgi:hypothetical protein